MCVEATKNDWSSETARRNTQTEASEMEIKMSYIFCGIMTIYDEIWLLKYVVNER